jgi:hypothetical protein
MTYLPFSHILVRHPSLLRKVTVFRRCRLLHSLHPILQNLPSVLSLKKCAPAGAIAGGIVGSLALMAVAIASMLYIRHRSMAHTESSKSVIFLSSDCSPFIVFSGLRSLPRLPRGERFHSYGIIPASSFIESHPILS